MHAVYQIGFSFQSTKIQRSMLIQYAVEHSYDIYQIYTDEDYSGADRSRPAFNEMIEAASQHRFDVILAKTQSRFTRDMELVEKYLHGKFIEWGIRFIAVVDHVDTADLGNKKSRQINGLINEWYLEDLSNNVRSVLTHKRREGKYIAAYALFGYQKDPEDNNHLLIDPPAARVVRRIFELYLAGNGTSRIARTLNTEKIPTPTRYRMQRGKGYRPMGPFEDLWSRATVYRILNTRTYMGDLEQGRHKKVSYKSHKTVWLPKEQWIVVPGTHEPIISKEQYDRVQWLLHQRGRSGKTGQIHPLSGKVFCGICGGSMEQTGSGYLAKNALVPRRYFRCRISQRDAARCPGQPYQLTSDLEELLLTRIREHISPYLTPDLLGQVAVDERDKRRQKELRRERERVEAEIQRRRKAVQELYLDKSGGCISAAQFDELNREFLAQVEQLEKQRNTLEQKLEERGGWEEQKRKLEQCLEDMAHVSHLNRELVCLLVGKVVVYPPDPATNCRNVEILWNF